MSPFPHPVAQVGQFISFCGFAGAGKDVLADELIKLGYVRHNYGDYIKAFYDPFLRGEETVHSLTVRMLASAYTEGGVTAEKIERFTVTHLLPYVQGGYRISAFTEDRALKPHIRPILELGGELVYGHIAAQYTERLDELLQAGHRVINTRLCDLREANLSGSRGNVVYLIERSNWAPATDWDLETVQKLEDNDWIDGTFYNDYPTGEAWAQACVTIAHRLTAQADEHPSHTPRSTAA